MTLLYDDPCFLHHETGDHPERAERIRGIAAKLDEAGLTRLCRRPTFDPVARRVLQRVHSPAYVDEIWAISKSGGGQPEVDTVVGPSSYSVALMAAGSVCDATERLVRGEDRQALCIVRPPGHHALAGRCMGFCLFNNVAIGARLATAELGVDRVLIVDWDIHHGNGTQAAFWEDPQVGLLSIHRWPFYPGTGDDDETGSGPGLGTIVNLPVEFGISRRDYRTMFADELGKFADRLKPQLIYISAGFDSHHADPVGHLGLETEDFIDLTHVVLDVADAHAMGRVISVLEGGYHPQVLPECIAVHLAEMLRRNGQSSCNDSTKQAQSTRD